MSELSEENAKLAEENRQINVSIRKVLEDNAELTNRLIEIALRNEEGGDAIFGGDGRSPKAAAGAANTILSTSQEDMRKRRNELAEQVKDTPFCHSIDGIAAGCVVSPSCLRNMRNATHSTPPCMTSPCGG